MKNKTVIFGCGYHGRAAFRRCIKKKDFDVRFWVDNDPSKRNRYLLNKKIFSVNSLSNLNYDKIIFCGRNIKEQIKQYKKLKIRAKKILVWGSLELRPNKIQSKKRDDSLYKILKGVIKKLDNNSIPYWVDRSGLLSLIRKDNISSLSDFDLAIDIKNLKQVFKLFKSNPSYKVFKGFVIKEKKFPKIFFKSKNLLEKFEPANIDIIFYIFKKNRVYQYDNLKKHHPIKYFKNFENIKFGKINFKVPIKPKKYLTHR